MSCRREPKPRPRSNAWLALGVAALLALVGCATLAQPGPVDAAFAAERWPGTTLDDLAQGRSLYVKRCAGCHALYRPERYPPERWAPHIDEMAERAALKAGERETLLRFLLTMSRPQAPESPLAQDAPPR
ncbi:MAG: cytochrome c [Deltaproteobacteria bacterium]|nr:cytochrome c [Deltaproteobacteria bacterium]